MTVRWLLILSSFMMPAKAMAARAVMEGIQATNKTIFVDTGTARVNISTDGYRGNVPNVGLYSSSNVVVSNTAGNNCVIYATGSIQCVGTVAGSADPTNPWTRNGVTISPTTSGDTVLFSGPTNSLGTETKFSSSTFNHFARFNSPTNFEAAINSHNGLYIGAVSTIGPQGYASNVTKSSGTLNNMYDVVASTPPSTGTSSMTITGLTAGAHGKVVFGFTQTTSAGILYIRFNQDINANYKWVFSGVNSNAGAVSDNGNNGAVTCKFQDTAVGSGGVAMGECRFFIFSNNMALVSCNTVYTDANPFLVQSTHACQYIGGSAPTSIQFATTAGSTNGTFYLSELIVPNP